MSRWHPWRALRGLAHVKLDIVELPVGQLGDTDGVGHIRLATGLLQAERRSTLTHELVHIERGDLCACTDAEDARVHRIAARRLITHEALADALLWTLDEQELAEDLWVDVDTVRARLADLSDTEKDDLYERLWSRDEGTA